MKRSPLTEKMFIVPIIGKSGGLKWCVSIGLLTYAALTCLLSAFINYM